MPGSESRRDEEQGRPPEPLLRQILEAVRREQHREQRQARAGQVETRGLGIAELRQQPRPHRQQQDHHRYAHQEHRSPPEVLQQDPAQRRTQRAPRGVAGDPNPDRDATLPRVVEHVADQRERRGRQRGPGQPQQRARRDQHGRAGRECGEEGRGPERGGADQQQPAPANPVPQVAHGDQPSCDQEPVDVHDPEELGARGPQVGGERRHREVEHGQVHGVQQARQRDDGQAEPLLAPRPRGDRSAHDAFSALSPCRLHSATGPAMPPPALNSGRLHGRSAAAPRPWPRGTRG